MASGHVNRVNRPDTWLHRPMLQNVKKALANPEPSTHGTSLHFAGLAAWRNPINVRPVPDTITAKFFKKAGEGYRPFLVNFSAMITFRPRGEIGGGATSPASDVQVGRSRSLRFMLRNQHWRGLPFRPVQQATGQYRAASKRRDHEPWLRKQRPRQMGGRPWGRTGGTVQGTNGTMWP